MAEHNKLGEEGERLAVIYLKKKGYQILHTNWRFGKYELDIIAKQGELLHFVEVKYRSSKTFGFPEESVSKKKFQNLANAATEYLYHHPEYRDIRFDILSINHVNNQDVEYFMIEDVYM